MELGGAAYAHTADAATFDGVESFWEFTMRLGRPLDAAVLNVGIAMSGSFAENSLEAELRLIGINVTGTVHLAKRVVQHMVPRKSGKILLVSSLSATTPTPFETTYGPSKAFGFSFAESLREELREHGIAVTALLPGATNTDFHRNAGLASAPIGSGKKNDKVEVARQGFEALMADLDHVVGGDEATKQVAIVNRTLSETVKAARHGAAARLT